MKKSNVGKIICIISLIILLIVLAFLVLCFMKNKSLNNDSMLKVNLTKLTYTVNNDEKELTKYTQDEFEKFKEDYNSNNLPDIYVTEFLFDGVGMYKTYDLDDFIEEGNETKVKIYDGTVINIDTTGSVELDGEITNGMIAVNTNDKNEDLNIILNQVRIDTDSKKVPAIYVYNKYITYTSSKVTISALKDTNNYIEGGKLKKVSLIGSDELSSYSNNYSGDSKTWYDTYTNYYGVYTNDEINNILFAKVQADKEDLQDGDPYYFYKAAGAISSDIDLYFEGEGYLEVVSKNKEGIETKGNLTFSGSIGDYIVKSEDDCLNTTTKSSVSNARNTLTIDVNSLVAYVDPSEDADEGDAIDSNGTLIINGGTIIALAHPGQDAGIDSENGTYINGGNVIATGDMYDQIREDSKQNFIVLSFNQKVQNDNLITLLNENEESIFAFKTDRTYTNLVYSSPKLTNGTYSLYKDGTITGENSYGFYNNIESYEKGTLQGYSNEGIQGGMMNQKMNNDSNMTPPDNENNMSKPDENMTPPEKPSGNIPNMDNYQKLDMNDENMTPPDNNMDSSATNKDFIINGISNQFSGVANYIEE